MFVVESPVKADSVAVQRPKTPTYEATAGKSA